MKQVWSVVAACVLMSTSAVAQPWGMGPGMMGWSWDGYDGPGWAWFGLMHILWWILIVLVIAVLVRWLLGRGPHSVRPGREDRARAILRERFARGEIDKTEFEDRLRTLKD